MEFLGDSVLGSVISLEIYQRFPLIDEGQLSRLRSSLVRGQTLAKLAKTLNISESLLLGQGELKSGGFRRESIQADAFEAILGAIFLDSNYATVSGIILKLYDDLLNESGPEDYKCKKSCSTSGGTGKCVLGGCFTLKGFPPKKFSWTWEI